MFRQLISVAVVVMIIGCAQCSHQQTPTKPDSRVAQIVLTGPSTVAPGATVHVSLISQYFNGTTQDVSSQATWSSSNSDVLLVAAGDVTGVQNGEAGIIAEYSGTTIRKVVTVLPDGTFTVTGRVADANFALPGARVNVVSGTGAGQAAVADDHGAYKLYGLAGIVELQVSALEYQMLSRTLEVSANLQSVNLTLRPVEAPRDLSGDWQLSIDASPSCGSLIDSARHRTYVATISQDVSNVAVRLSGAEFARDRFGDTNRFSGRIVHDVISLNIQSLDYYGMHYDLAEILSDGQTYIVVAKGTGAATASTISGTLEGTIRVDFAGQESSSCTAADHHFTFVRPSKLPTRQ